MKKREPNIDLFRLIATVFVVILHVLGQGGIISSTPPGGVGYWTASFLNACVCCAVNCFALVSGYVMVGKTVKLKNIIGLWIQAAFISVLITAMFFVFSPECRTVKNAVIAFLPIVGRQWWYMSAYFVLYLFIPVLNTAVEYISRRTYKYFLIGILIGICVIDCAVPLDPFAMKAGYSAIWLIVVYLFGAYIRKYDIKQRISSTKCFIGYFAMVTLAFLSKIGIFYLSKKILGFVKYDDTFLAYTSVTTVLASVFLFLFFLQIPVGKTAEKLVGFLSPVSLGVYLIHVHPMVFDLVLKNLFAPLAQKHPAIMIAYALGGAFAIFLLCAAIELLRIQFFRMAGVDKLCEKISQGISRICVRIFGD